MQEILGMVGLRLDGKVAWVTGSSRGLGKAIALLLSQLGAKVVVNCRSNIAQGQAVVEEIIAQGGQALLVGGDVMDESEIQRMAEEIEEHWGGVDILVTNATPPQPMKFIADYQWAEYLSMYDAFVKSPFLLAQRLLPGMRAGRWGRIVQITSEVFHEGMPEFSAYVAAKGAQVGWSRSMANELAADGITVNCVAPGWIPVERHEEVPQEAKDAYAKMIPVGRWGKPIDVAWAVAWFASEEAGFLTGQTLIVNGGRSLH
jgi:3-oxoacyl-[acyl-carrier protein] reductase